jgi:hypothetical protein
MLEVLVDRHIVVCPVADVLMLFDPALSFLVVACSTSLCIVLMWGSWLGLVREKVIDLWENMLLGSGAGKLSLPGPTTQQHTFPQLTKLCMGIVKVLERL